MSTVSSGGGGGGGLPATQNLWNVFLHFLSLKSHLCPFCSKTFAVTPFLRAAFNWDASTSGNCSFIPLSKADAKTNWKQLSWALPSARLVWRIPLDYFALWSPPPPCQLLTFLLPLSFPWWQWKELWNKCVSHGESSKNSETDICQLRWQLLKNSETNVSKYLSAMVRPRTLKNLSAATNAGFSRCRLQLLLSLSSFIQIVKLSQMELFEQTPKYNRCFWFQYKQLIWTRKGVTDSFSV